jgi:hypothetical protein
MNRRLTGVLSRDMNGLGDVPFDYGRPFAGRIMAPYTGEGGLGQFPTLTPNQWLLVGAGIFGLFLFLGRK